MSSFGTMYAQIIARQREIIRQQQVRDQCENLIITAERKIEELKSNPKYATFLSDMKSIKSEISNTRSIMVNNPDQALTGAMALSDKVTSIMSIAISKEQQWSEDRRIAYQEVARTIEEVRSVPIQTRVLQREMETLLKRLESQLDIATTSRQRLSFVKEIRDKVEDIKLKDQKELARREVVKKVIAVLTQQGFIVDKPKIVDNIVHVNGKLPSGKAVIFQVMDDNLIKFDFDGYEGKSCKDELDVVLERINGEEGIEAEIEQFVWKNPDKIKKGTIDTPFGSPAARSSGSRR